MCSGLRPAFGTHSLHFILVYLRSGFSSEFTININVKQKLDKKNYSAKFSFINFYISEPLRRSMMSKETPSVVVIFYCKL